MDYKQQQQAPQYYQQQPAGYPPQDPYKQPYAGVPANQPPVSTDGRFSNSGTSQYKDLWASALFGVHLIAFIVLSYFGLSHVANGGLGSSGSNNTSNGTITVSPPLSQDARNGLIIEIAVGCLIALILSAGYVFLMKTSGRALIKISIIFNILANAAMVAFAFVIKAYVLAAFNIIFLLITCLFFWFARHRIPLAALIMETVSKINSRFPFIYGMAILSIIFQFAYSVYWTVTTAGVQSKFSKDSSGAQAILIIFMVFSGYWVFQVLQNSLHVSISGTVASVYFLDNTPMMPQNPTLAAAKRAFTTSFGPICYGSLLIALIQTLRFILNQAAQQHSILRIIVDCIMGCIQSLFEYFTSYAYVHVAVYGKSFCEAAKDTWALVKSHGIDAIINDSLIGTVLGFGQWSVGLVAATLAYAIGYLSVRNTPDYSNPSIGLDFYIILIAVAVFLVGLFMMGVVSMVVSSGVQTTFVVLAEEPQAIFRTNQELYEKFKAVYPQIQWRV